MLGHKWKDAISLVEVFSKDQSYCLDAKEGLDICQASTLTQASNQAATWQEGSRTLCMLYWGCSTDKTVT